MTMGSMIFASWMFKQPEAIWNVLSLYFGFFLCWHKIQPKEYKTYKTKKRQQIQ